MPRRPDPRAVRKHRNYTVEEAARATKVAKGTVRRWLKAGLPAVTDRRPALILGSDLIAFLSSTKPKRQRCAIHQAYCFSCRAPRDPALGEVVIVAIRGGSARFWAMCAECETEMHRSLSAARITELEALVTVSFGPGAGRINEGCTPIPNEHFD